MYLCILIIEINYDKFQQNRDISLNYIAMPLFHMRNKKYLIFK